MVNLLFIYIKIALMSFGGGAVMTSLMQKEFVETGIISTDFFVKALSLSQGTPGPIGAGIGSYIGYELFGLFGVIIANIGMSLPTVIIVIFYSDFLRKHKENIIIENVFRVLRPITVALIFSIFIYFLRVCVFNNSSIEDLSLNFNLGAAIIVITSFIFIMKFKVNPVLIMLMCAVLGAVIV